MTDKECISGLEVLKQIPHAKNFVEHIDMAIKALEQQTCEDCISRKDTIEWLKKVTVTEGIEFKTGFEQILYDIEQMPSVTPKTDVLNKIRAEIIQLPNLSSNANDIYKADVLAIIDKYKSESEDKI